MSKALFLCLVLCFAGGLHAQENIKNYVQANTIPLSTISPDSGEDAGLLAIARAIGDARVVFLGEEDHGDAPTFLAKTRLIKYLHEKMGFNVLAFESDFFALTQGWERLPKDEQSIDTFVRHNVYPVWTSCHTCQELFFEYLPGTFKTGVPLQLAGFDNQLFFEYTWYHLPDWLDSVIRALRFPVAENPLYTKKILPAVDSALMGWLRDNSRLEKIDVLLDSIEAEASTRLSPDDFAMMVIRNLAAEKREYRAVLSTKRADQENGIKEARDRQMGRNLEWLTRVRYPKEKIIVWAASEHTARMTGNFPDWASTFPSFGDEFMQDSARRRKSYSIAFSSLQGRGGRLGFPIYDLPKMRADGFERWMPPMLEYGFVDFKPYTLAHPDAGERFFLSGLGHLDVRAVWNRVFDGVIYIKAMYPCKR